MCPVESVLHPPVEAPLAEHLVPVQRVQAIGIVGQILEAVAAITELRFVCVAHVTAQSWTACAVLDRSGLGLQTGHSLPVSTLLCRNVCGGGQSITIAHASRDPVYRNHQAPRLYGFESYVSVPIRLADGSVFGTLCGLDARPMDLNRDAVSRSLELFAQMLGLQLDQGQTLADARQDLLLERNTADLREQFIGVLGHDLRTPLQSILLDVDVLGLEMPRSMLDDTRERIGRSARRMAALIEDVMDFTRGRMGGGIATNLVPSTDVDAMLAQVVAELHALHPHRQIESQIQPDMDLRCDVGRLGQLLSNLLGNALEHGDVDKPVIVGATLADGEFRLSVSNGGARLPTAVIAQLFKPYWRGRAKHTQRHDGLGLGLFIASEIAKSHGGSLGVNSTDDTTEFCFKMPAAPL